MELVDIPDLKSGGECRAGSSPAARTSASRLGLTRVRHWLPAGPPLLALLSSVRSDAVTAASDAVSAASAGFSDVEVAGGCVERSVPRGRALSRTKTR